MANREIRDRVDASGLRWWQVADKIGVHPTTLTIWLRHELTGERLERVEKAVDELLGEL